MDVGDIVAQRFRLDARAGEGGMGVVFRAHDLDTDALVALKVMNGAGADRDRFARESEVLRALVHPAIVRYVAHGETPSGAPWLAMEWLEGIDLETRLAHGGLDPEDAIVVARRAAAALGAAHARGVVHRDIKPSNVFLPGGDPAQATILDFGIARPAGSSGHFGHTRTGAVIGTPGYMSPEQARGEPTIDARADVFSLGCVLFECLTGRAPFVAEHVVAILAKVLLEDAPRLRDLLDGVPTALDELVSRMLSKNRDLRPAEGASVERELAVIGPFGSVPHARVRQEPTSLTNSEQRWASVVIASGRRLSDTIDIAAPTLLDAEMNDADASVVAAARESGARFEILADGSRVLLLTGSGAATDLAVRAARCALAVRGALRDIPTALATGRARVSDRLPLGEALDRAAARVRAHEGPTLDGVRIDEVTTGLLDGRFDVRGDEHGLVLHAERELPERSRTLLGRKTPCVGRDREIETLVASWDECVAESVARATLLTAPAGVGKSRVRHEFVQRVQSRNERGQVWMGRADSARAGTAFGLLAPSIRRTAGIFEDEPLAVRQQKLRARVARSVDDAARARVTEFLGEWIATPFPDDASVQLRAARADRMLMGDQMRSAWEDFLEAECALGPVLIVLEDLQWGDLPSVALIDRALRNLRDRPWMVLAVCRPEVHERFPRLWVDRPVHEIRLAELSRRASEKLVRAVLGDRVAPARVTQIVERAMGNAFFLEELIRAEADGKGEAVPDTVMAMVDLRLGTLDAECRRVLRAASVFGEVCWKGGVAALTGLAPNAPELTSRLGELEEAELMTHLGEGRFVGGAEYAFRHTVVRDAAYGMLVDEDRALGHRLAAQWLEQVHETDGLTVAAHYERGGERARAVEWYVRAADQAMTGNDFGAALERAEHGIACGASGELRGMLERFRAEAHRWRGEYPASIEAGERAIELLEPGTRWWNEAAEQLLTVAGYTGRNDIIHRVLGIVERLHAIGEPTGATVVVVARGALSLSFNGEHAAGDAAFASAELACGRLRDLEASVEGKVCQCRAHRAVTHGDVGTFLDLSLRAAAASERAGDARSMCASRGSVGYGLYEVGAWEEAEPVLRSALAMADRLGIRNVSFATRHNLGIVLGHLGGFDEARRLEKEAIDAFVTQGDRRLEAGARLYLAEIHALAGDLASAEHEVRLALEYAPPAHGSRIYALALLARTLIDATPPGRAIPAEAIESARAAMAILEGSGAFEYGEALVHCVHAEALEACGERERARRGIEAAWARLLERANTIADPTRRRSFLERVPANARTAARARAWGIALPA